MSAWTRALAHKWAYVHEYIQYSQLCQLSTSITISETSQVNSEYEAICPRSEVHGTPRKEENAGPLGLFPTHSIATTQNNFTNHPNMAFLG